MSEIFRYEIILPNTFDDRSRRRMEEADTEAGGYKQGTLERTLRERMLRQRTLRERMLRERTLLERMLLVTLRGIPPTGLYPGTEVALPNVRRPYRPAFPLTGLAAIHTHHLHSLNSLARYNNNGAAGGVVELTMPISRSGSRPPRGRSCPGPKFPSRSTF